MTRTLVIGLDGCSWNVLEPLLETGELPNLSALREQGASGVLESTVPFYTGPAWASYATGCSPAAHGIYDFMMLRADGRLSVASQSDLRRPTYYRQLGAEGKRSVLINLPLDQDGCEGAVIVNSWLTDDEGRRIFPVSRRERYRQPLDAYKNYPTTFDAPLETHVDDLCSLEQARFDLARELFLGEDWDHFFVLFSSTDWLGHALTGRFLNGDQVAREAFLRLYSQLDSCIGWLLDNAPDAVSAVISDHGQCAETHTVRVNALLRELGLVTLVRDRSSGEPGAIRVPPAFRRLSSNKPLRSLARAVKRQLQSRLDIELVLPREGVQTDRRRSRAFTPTVASYAIHGRDLDKPQQARIRDALVELRLDDGRPAFDGVWTFEELYGRTPGTGSPALVYAPAVGVRPSVEISTPLVDRVSRDGRGAHQRDGVVFLAGSSIAAGDLGRVSLYDLAPTLLWAMDTAVPSGCDGRVLYEAFKDEFARDRELREIEYEETGPTQSSSEGEEVVVGRLKALGYL